MADNLLFFALVFDIVTNLVVIKLHFSDVNKKKKVMKHIINEEDKEHARTLVNENPLTGKVT